MCVHENSLVGIIQVTNDLIIADINSRSLEIFGLNTKKQNIVGLALSEIKVFKDSDIIYLKELIINNSIESIYTFELLSGVGKWIKLCITVDKCTIDHFTFYLIDISDEKLISTTYVASYQLLFDEASEGVLIVQSGNHKIMLANKMFLEMTRCSDVFDLPVSKFHKVISCKGKNNNRGSLFPEVEVYTENRKKLYCDITISRNNISVNGVDCYFEFLTDVTEVIQSKLAIERTNNILFTINKILIDLTKKTISWDMVKSICTKFGKLTEVNGCYIYQRVENKNEYSYELKYRWESSELSISSGTLYSHIDREIKLDVWEKDLENCKVIHESYSSADIEKQEILNILGAKSMLLVPIMMMNGRLFCWGFVGFCDFSNERAWDDNEIKALRSLSSVLGMLISRLKEEEIQGEVFEKISTNFRQLSIQQRSNMAKLKEVSSNFASRRQEA